MATGHGQETAQTGKLRKAQRAEVRIATDAQDRRLPGSEENVGSTSLTYWLGQFHYRREPGRSQRVSWTSTHVGDRDDELSPVSIPCWSRSSAVVRVTRAEGGAVLERHPEEQLRIWVLARFRHRDTSGLCAGEFA